MSVRLIEENRRTIKKSIFGAGKTPCRMIKKVPGFKFARRLPSTGEWLLIILLAVSVAFVSGLWVQGNWQIASSPAPPYGLEDEIDEEDLQHPAVIQLSDPQIYARETLINDRRREADYLERLIENSDKVHFEPQLHRDLKFYSSLTARLSGSWSTKEVLGKAKLEASEGGEPSGADASGEVQPTKGSTDAPSLTSRAPAKIEATPREIFHDRQAYREELRAALAAVQLDDAHDLGENAIYRLQFRATVLPGKRKNEYGVARLTLTPPNFTGTDFESLYRIWLSHITFRLNETAGTESVSDLNYELFGSASGLFELIYLPLPIAGGSAPGNIAEGRSCRPEETLATNGKNCTFIRLAVFSGLLRPGDKGSMKIFLRGQMLRGRLEKFTSQLGNIIGRLERELEISVDRHNSAVTHLTATSEQETEARAARSVARNRASIAKAALKSAEIRLDTAQREFEGAKVRLGTPSDSARIEWDDAYKMVEEANSELSEALAAVTYESARYLEQTLARDHAWNQTGMTYRAKELAQDQRNLFNKAFELDENCEIRYPDNESLEFPEGFNAAKLYNYSKLALRYSGSISAALRGLLGRDLFERVDPKSLERLVYEMSLAPSTARTFLTAIKVIVPKDRWKCLVEHLAEGTQGAAEEAAFGSGLKRFFESLTLRNNGLYGTAFAYTTTPTELSQRLSTAASAVNSMELALGLEAMAGGSDLSIGLGTLRAGQAKIDTLQRLPLIVGFSERDNKYLRTLRDSDIDQAAAKSASNQELVKDDSKRGENWQYPQFGWIFGPKAVFNSATQKLELRQAPGNYSVTADISVPGWWPHLDLTLHTAWIGNWHKRFINHSTILAGDQGTLHEEEFRVQLPLNRADLDGLTELLAKLTVGGAIPVTRISAVRPGNIVVCENEATFLIYGSNLWRGPEAFLNGRRHKEIRVLPDMAGIAATFDVRNLPRAATSPDQAELTVWTRHGAATSQVSVIDKRVDEANARRDGKSTSSGVTCGPGTTQYIKK